MSKAGLSLQAADRPLVAGEFYRDDELLVRRATGFGSKTCFVTFQSYSDTRTLEREGFGDTFLAKREVDAFHIISRDNDWYQYAQLPKVLARIAAETAAYQRVVAYGSSMGGYAAIRLGGLAGAHVALAFSPQFSIDRKAVPFERRWSADAARIDFCLERSPPGPPVAKVYVVYDPHDADLQHVARLRKLTKVSEIRLPYAGHPTGGYLAETGLIGRLVMDVANDKLLPQHLRRLARSRRKQAPQFYFNLSKHARWPKVKLSLAEKAVEVGPRNFAALMHLGQVLAEQGRFDEAEAALARAEAINPLNPPLLLVLSQVQEQRGDIAAALAAMTTLCRNQPAVNPYTPRLRHLERLQRERGGLLYADADSDAPPLGRRLVDALLGRARASEPASARRAAVAADVLVTTTLSPPPFVHSWKRHNELIGRLPRARFDLFLVGDSHVQHWPEALWAPLNVVNFGVEADKTQHALWRLRQLADGRVRCRNALVLLGTNNLGANDTARGIAAGLEAVAAELTRVAPGAQRLVLSTPPCGPKLGFRKAVRREANRLAAESLGPLWLDIEEALAPLDAEETPHLTADAIHLSESGYRVITDLVKSRLTSSQNK